MNALCPWCERGDQRVPLDRVDNDGRRWHDPCARECLSTWRNAAEQARLRERDDDKTRVAKVLDFHGIATRDIR